MLTTRRVREGFEIYDALVLGGGFGGLHMLWELRKRGFSVIGLEAGEDVGGAWFWNRYPGARCDVESLLYCYSFSPEIDAEWRWTERYAGQKEIQSYISWVCNRLDIRKDFRFNARLTKAVYDDEANIWTFEVENGEVFKAHWFISAAGPISKPIWPAIPGREAFKGAIYHTAMWPRQEPDFAGKRVGLIGTGSSGTQLIPIVAGKAEHLTVLMRTPSYYTEARNRPLTDSDYALWEEIRERTRADVLANRRNGGGDVFLPEDINQSRRCKAGDFTAEQRREYMDILWAHGGARVSGPFSDVLINEETNAEVAEYLRGKIREVVKDAATADLLTPKDIPLGTRRVCVGTRFLETFNLPHVAAVDVKKKPIERFTEKGLVVDGREIEFDSIISATGFDALTGALTAIDIQGEGGRTIAEAWAGGPHTYLGIGIAGFPNLVMIGGPGSPSVLSNVVMTNELQVAWIADLLSFAREKGSSEIKVMLEAQERWTAQVQDLIKGTLLTKANSWYVGANVPGKARVILAYTGGLPRYLEACREVAADGYTGFSFDG